MARPAQAQGSGAAAAAVKAAYDKYKGLEEGKNADYIPALAKVPSNYLRHRPGHAPGALSTAGDIEPTFSIQSISKVFTLALVFQESGEDLIENSIGVDATGQVFNSINAVEQYRGKEMNPLVNPGAIATTGMVKGTPDEVWKKILGLHSDFAGRQLSVDQEVYKSEADTNQRNRAIGALMWAYERFKSDPAVATDIYTRQCAIAVNAKDLGNMAATLANGGKNPVTKKQVIDPKHVSAPAGGDGDRRALRRQRQVAVPRRPSGQERRRRRADRRVAGQVRDRHLRSAARRGRQQRARPEGDHRHIAGPRRQSVRRVMSPGDLFRCSGRQRSRSPVGSELTPGGRLPRTAGLSRMALLKARRQPGCAARLRAQAVPLRAILLRPGRSRAPPGQASRRRN